MTEIIHSETPRPLPPSQVLRVPPAMEAPQPLVPPGKPVKLVVWDLDHTLWDGILLESAQRPALIAGVAAVVAGLDQLGILQSIASRNDSDAAAALLRELGLLDYFLVPQISWSAKSRSVSVIAQRLDISLDSILFIDDQEFELEEVRSAHPQVRTLNAAHAPGLLSEGSIRPPVVTEDAPRRRLRYLADQARVHSEQVFTGPPEEFLSSLQLKLTIDRATAADLDRAAELVVRTNQLNSTGSVYSKDELRTFLESSGHTLLVAALEDRFGDYGKIGIALLEVDEEPREAGGSERRGVTWTLKLILVSCRVLSRGIGPVLLTWLLHRARAADVALRVEFRDTGRNRPMKVALMMAGFTCRQGQGETFHLLHDPAVNPSLPSYLAIHTNW